MPGRAPSLRGPALPPRARVFRLVAKYLVNPPMRWGVEHRIVPASVALIETTGRRSGLPRVMPVLNGLDGDTFWVFAEHGRDADYVKNLLADPHVRVNAGGRWRHGVANLLPDDDATARRRRVERRHGLMGRLDGLTFRMAATDPLTIRVDLA